MFYKSKKKKKFDRPLKVVTTVFCLNYQNKNLFSLHSSPPFPDRSKKKKIFINNLYFRIPHATDCSHFNK